LLVSALERHGRLVLEETTRTKVLQVSPATVDRLLQPARRVAADDRRRRSPARNSLKKRIPVRTSGDVTAPPIGMLEIDRATHRKTRKYPTRLSNRDAMQLGSSELCSGVSKPGEKRKLASFLLSIKDACRRGQFGAILRESRK
jgi:hypothetical protein